MTHSLLDHVGRTPLVALTRIGRGLPVPVLVKCEHMNPGGSIKDRLAKAIVEDAEARGVLRPGMTIIEATAGNTGVGLALVAAAQGYGLVCVMPEKMSADKRVALAALGAKVVITPNAPPSNPDNFRNVARRLAVENGWFLADQFSNLANVRVHDHPGANRCPRVGRFGVGAQEQHMEKETHGLALISQPTRKPFVRPRIANAPRFGIDRGVVSDGDSSKSL